MSQLDGTEAGNGNEEGPGHRGATLSRRNLVAWWVLGLTNNAGYVIMNAGAKLITPSLVALVYICNVVPSFTVKLTIPYWQHMVSFRKRMIVASVSLVLSFLVVILGQIVSSQGIQLLGIALGSLQSGLGEASLLSFSSRFPETRRCLTAWSSGTGMAGIFGFAFVALFTLAFGSTFVAALLAGLSIPCAYILCFFFVLQAPSTSDFAPLVDNMTDEDLAGEVEITTATEKRFDVTLVSGNVAPKMDLLSARPPSTCRERCNIIFHLWPYMLPLFFVYFAEVSRKT